MKSQEPRVEVEVTQSDDHGSSAGSIVILQIYLYPNDSNKGRYVMHLFTWTKSLPTASHYYPVPNTSNMSGLSVSFAVVVTL